MSLLKRIAISNGNKDRKADANKVLAAMDYHKVVNWHQSLGVEIRRKEEKCCPLVQLYRVSR